MKITDAMPQVTQAIAQSLLISTNKSLVQAHRLFSLQVSISSLVRVSHANKQ